MTEHEQTLYTVRGFIGSLPTENQEEIQACYRQLKKLIEGCGDNGRLAMALLGAELSVEAG